MKKIILFIMLSVLNIIVKCQTFSAAVEPWDNAVYNGNGNGCSFLSNVGVFINDQQSGFLRSYLNMFKATKDIHYLEKFAIQATRVMENRFLSPKRPNSHCHAELVSASQNNILTL